MLSGWPRGSVATPKWPREVAALMAAPRASLAAVRDFCALPGLPDGRSAEDAAREALSSIVGGCDGEAAAGEIVSMYRAEAAASGEKGVLSEQSLLADDALCFEILSMYDAWPDGLRVRFAEGPLSALCHDVASTERRHC